MKPPNKTNAIWQKLRAGQVLNVCCIGNFASPRMVDFVCRSGHFDVIWFDLEHFDITVQELAVLNMVTRAYPMATIARFKPTDYQVVMRVLETGVDGIMCAMVEDDIEARQIVKWAKFHNPHPAQGEATGSRGWNSGNIDGCYGNIPAPDYIHYQNTQTIVLAQIEHDRALAKAREIASTPGIDGLFFGPADYAAGLGIAGQITSAAVYEAMGRVARAATEEGKWWGTLGVGPEMYARVRQMGARFISPGGDLKIANLGLRELVKTFGDFQSEPSADARSAY